jgi:hypothetical protein
MSATHCYHEWSYDQQRRTVMVVLTAWILLGIFPGTARATPVVVPFDGQFNYGFDQEKLDLVVTKHFSGTDWQLAADPSFNPNPEEFLLLITPTDLAYCEYPGPQACSSTYHTLEVTWDIVLNENHPAVQVSQGLPLDVNLFLATWQQDPAFASMEVSVFYDSPAIDGSDAIFDVAQYNDIYHFLSLDLGNMTPGVDGTIQVSVAYEVVGELTPGDDPEPLLLAPFLATAAFAQPIPEPGTALLMSLGLVGIALQRRGGAR